MANDRGAVGVRGMADAEARAAPAWEQEVRALTNLIADTWMEQGEARGLRRALRGLLEDRFGELPEALAWQIAYSQDPVRLYDAVLQASRLERLEDFQLETLIPPPGGVPPGGG